MGESRTIFHLFVLSFEFVSVVLFGCEKILLLKQQRTGTRTTTRTILLENESRSNEAGFFNIFIFIEMASLKNANKAKARSHRERGQVCIHLTVLIGLYIIYIYL